MSHSLIRFQKAESINDIITLHDNKVYKQNGDTWIGEDAIYNFKRSVQLAIPFPDYKSIYEVRRWSQP